MKGIYKITSPNGSVYIGQSNNIEKRKKYYTPGRCKNQKYINASLKKYGHKNHTFEIIQILDDLCSQETLDNYEIKWFNYFKSLGIKMLNLKQCGNGGGKHSDVTKKLLSKISKERFKSIGDYEIYQYDHNLNLVERWEYSILDIAKLKKFQAPSISRSLIANKSENFKMAHNYFWFFKKDLNNIKNINLSRVVNKNNQYGNFYMYW